MVKVEDLVRWSCSEEAGWSIDRKPASNGTNGVHKPLQNDQAVKDESSEPLNIKTESKQRIDHVLVRGEQRQAVFVEVDGHSSRACA